MANDPGCIAGGGSHVESYLAQALRVSDPWRRYDAFGCSQRQCADGSERIRLTIDVREVVSAMARACGSAASRCRDAGRRSGVLLTE